MVVARVSATNSYGTSTVSSDNTSGATIRQEPFAMSTPTYSAISETSITVDWTALTAPDNGNSDITTYNLYWDSGTGTSSISLTDSLVTTYTVSGLTAGTTYLFKVRA
jgi:hypothetical protein